MALWNAYSDLKSILLNLFVTQENYIRHQHKRPRRCLDSNLSFLKNKSPWVYIFCAIIREFGVNVPLLYWLEKEFLPLRLFLLVLRKIWLCHHSPTCNTPVGCHGYISNYHLSIMSWQYHFHYVIWSVWGALTVPNISPQSLYNVERRLALLRHLNNKRFQYQINWSSDVLLTSQTKF